MPGLATTDIHKVALVGKGYVGGYVYDKLVDAGFDVTVLSRSNPDNSASIRVVDYESTKSLTQALEGQDAVVSTISMAGWPHQYKLIDAAVAAGTVKHFIPSDFTALSANPQVAHLPYYRDAVAVQKYLRTKAEGAGMKWTVVQTGPIIGCVLNGAYAYNFKDRTALLVGRESNSAHKVSMTRGYTIGKAVVSIFGKTKELESGPIYIHDVVTSEQDILRIAEDKSGTKWSVSHADAERKLKEALGMFEAAGENPPPIFATFLVIHYTIFGGKYQTKWDGEGNKALGIPILATEEWEDLIAQRVRNEPIDGGLPWNSAPKPRK
ncbi:Isoflavone reductase-like protein PCBER1 [Colletotrichum spinosum]|uniref:Isoflavone reductase-like protein PCBER1 n=1 Tax=Colletotrichum spinosum TaxID=1347390 RepID=A0A4R8PWY9_9PEZI|nr:Isoflavone reductase-like protein PCBER1 [Colletotrichum spinosum]